VAGQPACRQCEEQRSQLGRADCCRVNEECGNGFRPARVRIGATIEVPPQSRSSP
jgi:hypothetical protein